MKRLIGTALVCVVCGTGCRDLVRQPPSREVASTQNAAEIAPPVEQAPTTMIADASENANQNATPLPRNNMQVMRDTDFSAIASGKKPGDKALAQLVTGSLDYLEQQQAQIIKEFHLGSYNRYDMDQRTGEIVFSVQGGSNQSVPKVIAKMQLVGDISTRSNTWLWAWANPSLNPVLCTGAGQVRVYGTKHQLESLTLDTWPANEVDGWAMTAITAKILHAKGAYRIPARQGPLFAVLTSLRWAKP